MVLLIGVQERWKVDEMDGAMKLRGKVAVVTGASQGLGEHLSLELAARGAKVALAARNQDRLEMTVSRIREAGGTGLAIPCDLRKESDCEKLIDSTLGAFEEIDALILSAGSATFGGVKDLHTFAPIREAMATNFFGAALPAYLALPHLIASQGVIAFVTSGAGRLPMPGYVGYSTSKHAMNGFFETLRLEMSTDGVDVVAIDPGEMYSDDGAGRSVLGPDGIEYKVDLSIRRKNDVSRVPASLVAKRCVEAIVDRRREVSFSSGPQRMATMLRPLAPRMVDRKIYERTAKMRSAFLSS
jgi:NAD(P)-dependent dehydrogenase (short-subunit alcohol dehydrogenase family)